MREVRVNTFHVTTSTFSNLMMWTCAGRRVHAESLQCRDRYRKEHFRVLLGLNLKRTIRPLFNHRLPSITRPKQNTFIFRADSAVSLEHQTHVQVAVPRSGKSLIVAATPTAVQCPGRRRTIAISEFCPRVLTCLDKYSPVVLY